METSDVNRPWALVLPIDSAGSLLGLRDLAGLGVGCEPTRIWLRGSAMDAALRTRLLGIPALERYFAASDGALTPWGKLVPCEQLPACEWIPLRAWRQPVLPSPRFPVTSLPQVPLRLERDSAERPATGLMLEAIAWANFIASASRIRFAELTFAMNAKQQVIVRGKHLPSLPGTRLTEDFGILIPAGWSWRPAISGPALRDALRLLPGESALWLESNRWERIAPDAWVVASRSAVRASLGATVT